MVEDNRTIGADVGGKFRAARRPNAVRDIINADGRVVAATFLLLTTI